MATEMQSQARDPRVDGGPGLDLARAPDAEGTPVAACCMSEQESETRSPSTGILGPEPDSNTDAEAPEESNWNRLWGGVKMVGGALETTAGAGLVVAGAATSELGVGIPLAAAGVAVTAHGADVTVSGARTLWTGTEVDTLTSEGLQELGMERSTANLADAGISVVGSLGASAAVRAPAAAASTVDDLAQAGDDVVRAAAGGADEATTVAENSVTLAFKPGAPTGHNMVGVTVDGSTEWSHLVVGGIDEVSGGMSRVASPGAGARVVESSAGPSSSYLRATVPVSRANAQAAQSLAQSNQAGSGAAGAYSYMTNNCTTYATSVMREAGVVAPSTTPAGALATTALQSPQVMTPVTTAATGVTGAVLMSEATGLSTAETAEPESVSSSPESLTCEPEPLTCEPEALTSSSMTCEPETH